MIATGFYSFIGTLLKKFAEALPNSPTWSDNLVEMLTWIFETAMGLNWLFPVGSIVTVLILVIGVETVIASWYGTMWLLRMLRGN